MGLALRRCFRMVDLAFVAGAGLLCAATVKTLLAHPLQLPRVAQATEPLIRPTKAALDAAAVSRTTGLPLVPGPAATSEPASTALPVHLLGTSVSDVPELSLATIQDAARREAGVFAVGDWVQGARVVAIERLRVLVDNRGQPEVIDLEGSIVQERPGAGAPPLAAATARPREIERRALVDVASNPRVEMGKMSWAPAAPGSTAWKLARLAPDSLLAQVGLTEGDIVHNVNGTSLTDPTQAVEALARLEDATRVELQIERKGVPLRLIYHVRG